MDAASRQKTRGLTQEAFDRLLDRLDPDRSAAGEEYERIRRKLVKFFAWAGSLFPEDHADEAINRVARKLTEREPILDLERYMFGVARLVSKEALHQQQRSRAVAQEISQAVTASEEPMPDEQVLLSLRECLEQLSGESRDLIVRYYQGEKQVRIANRKKLALELGIPVNAVRNRALRLREKLEQCVGSRLNGKR